MGSFSKELCCYYLIYSFLNFLNPESTWPFSYLLSLSLDTAWKMLVENIPPYKLGRHCQLAESSLILKDNLLYGSRLMPAFQHLITSRETALHWVCHEFLKHDIHNLPIPGLMLCQLFVYKRVLWRFKWKNTTVSYTGVLSSTFHCRIF